MLGMTDEKGSPLVAFCAIHAVCPEPDQSLGPSKLREETVRKMRAQVPGTGRARFFYFTDYKGLAEELYAEGWLGEEQCEAIASAHDREQAAISSTTDDEVIVDPRFDFGVGFL